MPTLPGLEDYLPEQEEQPNYSQMSAQQAQLLENLKKIKAMAQPAQQQPTSQMVVPNAVGSYLAQAPIDPQQRELERKMNDKIAESQNQQKLGIGQLEQFKRDIASKPRGVDFSALAGYFDSNVPGSKLSQNYKAPETQEEKEAKILQIEGALQKAKQGLTASEIAALKAQMDTHSTRSSDRQASQEANRYLRKEDTFRKDLSKIADPLAEDSQRLSTLETNLGSGDWQKVANSLSNFSRSVAGEKGVLTDQDIARVLPANFQGSLAKFESYFAETPTAKIDPAYTKALVELVQTAKQKTADRYDQMIKQRKTAYGHPASAYRDVMAGPGGSMFDELGTSVQGLRGAPAQQQAPPKDPKARLEELRRKAQGG